MSPSYVEAEICLLVGQKISPCCFRCNKILKSGGFCSPILSFFSEVSDSLELQHEVPLTLRSGKAATTPKRRSLEPKIEQKAWVFVWRGRESSP